MTADAAGGVWTYAIDLAHGLARAGVETVLATMGGPLDEARREEARTVPGLVVEESAFRLEWMEDAGHDVERAGRWLLGLERRHRPDVLHLNGFAHAVLPFAAPRIVVAHSCVGSWWQAVRGEAPPARCRRMLERVALGLKAADLVIAPTAAFLAEIVRLYGPLPRCRVIWNGRDPALFEVADKGDYVFGAGRVWDDAKNFQALDRVARDLAWPVVVAGDWRPPERPADPPQHLLCLDLVEPARLRTWLAEAPIFALPARYEPFGLAPLEAALSGCALVLGDIPTLREVWGDAACFVAPDDHRALRHALERLIADPGLRRRMARKAARRARRYGLERMTRRYLAAYREVRARPRSSTGNDRTRTTVAAPAA